MVDLIARVRLETGAGTAAFTVDAVSAFTDDHLQDTLDRHVRTFRQVPVEWEPDWTGGGSTSWLEARIPYRHLEAGTAFVLEDSLGANVGTASFTLDAQEGRVTFGADQGGTVYYATGRAYDVWGAIAEVLETWAAAEARSFDFSSDASKFSRSQKAAGLREQARLARQRSHAVTVRLSRRDG